MRLALLLLPIALCASDLDTVYIELGDLKKSVRETKADLALLEEKQNLTSLEKRISSIESTLSKITADLKTLSSTIATTQNSLAAYDEKIHELAKIKTTLTSLISKKPTTYTVKSGDSLDKIARHHQTTSSHLRKINNLSSDKIVIGQEIRLEQ